MAYSKARRLSDLISATGEVAAYADASIVPADLHSTLDLTGKTITVANTSTGDSDTTVANTAFVQQEIAALVASAPGTLNTLNELAAALGDDASFSTTVTDSIALKAPLASPTFTGTLEIPNLTISSAQGSDGQVLTSTGSGIAWEAVPAGTTINNNANNRIITGSGTADTLEGEATLTYNGAKLAIANSSSHSFVDIIADNGAFSGMYFSDQQGAGGELSYDHVANEFKIWSGGAVSGSPHLKIKNTYIDAGEMTAYLQLPSGTTAQRPTGANGMMRYNESESKTEIYQGSDWKSIDTTGYSYAIQYVVVAGGGAGGAGAYSDAAGGAGGGGYRSSVTSESSGRGASAESAMTANVGTQYTITVGAGGSNAVGGNSSISGSGLTTITSNGGGEGGDRAGSNNKDGGCGGGGGYQYTAAGSGTTGQGYDGGVYSGNPYVPGAAGGGAGSTATGSDNQIGGAGVATSITGSAVTYALGGHGGNTSPGASPVAGGANTGTGGGGYFGGGGAGGNGGSGAVMLKVPTATYSGTTTGSPAVTTVGDYKIIRFTSSGSYTA